MQIITITVVNKKNQGDLWNPMMYLTLEPAVQA